MGDISDLVGPAADRNRLREDQYRDSSKLEARANLHRKYGRRPNEIGWFEWVARHCAIPSGASVLEVGCGPGWLWEQGAAEFPDDLSITLSDLSAGMVDEAVERARSVGAVRGVVADAGELPFADGSFEAVLACHMLYHLSSPRAALLELRRVLRPDGIIVVTTNGETSMRELYGLRARVFGGPVADPGGTAFGLEAAKRLVGDLFVDTTTTTLEGELVVTDANDLVAAMTSFPPADTAPHEQVMQAKALIEDAMATQGGAFRIHSQSGLVRGRKG